MSSARRRTLGNQRRRRRLRRRWRSCWREVSEGLLKEERGRTNRVARGLEEIWGRLRNSSRSIVPELSYNVLSSVHVRQEWSCSLCDLLSRFMSDRLTPLPSCLSLGRSSIKQPNAPYPAS
jgi:hypothetical protein